ncbi:MAG: hypothetical protein ACHQKY_10980 [Terriglobia bacterium]
MKKTSKPDFLSILQTLRKHKVDFIIVGGVCAVLHGAPVSTFDLDLVHSRAPENVKRLMAALKSLKAYFREQGIRRSEPARSHLTSPGHQLLMTQYGPLDLLGAIGKNLDRGYVELLNDTSELNLPNGLKVRVLTLEKLIEIKSEFARDKDKAVLGLLRRTLEEARRR